MATRTAPAPRVVTALALTILSLVGHDARAELLKLDIHRREPFADGVAFGNAGPYEKLVGVARFAVDPAHARNAAIVDLALAPRNAAWKVEFESDVCILVPKDPAKGNRAILYDVNNRGNKLALRFFNGGPGGNDPTDLAAAGDGFLLRRGYTIVWSGWIGELLPGAADGNWEWRFRAGQLTDAVLDRLSNLTELYERGRVSGDPQGGEPPARSPAGRGST